MLRVFSKGHSHGDWTSDHKCLSDLPLPACTSRGAGPAQWSSTGEISFYHNYSEIYLLFNYKYVCLCVRMSPGWLWSAPLSWTVYSQSTHAGQSQTPHSLLSYPSSLSTSVAWGRPRKERIFTAGSAHRIVMHCSLLRCYFFSWRISSCWI